MKSGSRLVTAFSIGLLTAAGILVFFYAGNQYIRIAGIIAVLLAVLLILTVSGAPLPLSAARAFQLKVLLPVDMAVRRLFGVTEEEVYSAHVRYAALHNRSGGERILVLLPNCLQHSSCGKDLISSIQNCAACGRCQIGEILVAAGAAGAEVSLVGGGRLAVKKVKETRPDVIIAVACEKELIDGIKAVPCVPSKLIVNKRPNGPCRDTAIDIEELKEALKK